MRPRRMCGRGGCPRPRPCGVHRPPRPTTTQQGYGYAWQILRDQVIVERGGVCEIDGEGPRPRDPLVVDHRRARAAGGTDDRGNLIVVHKSEHSRKTVRVDGGFGRR